jgi:RsiW-degrading membrane proteinase PrsW (M82 family)
MQRESAFGRLVYALLAVFAVALYFLPSFVAMARGHQNGAAIVILNFLLGWSFIGWVVALVWAFTEVRRTESATGSGTLADPKKGLMVVFCIAVASLIPLALLIVWALWRG